MLHVLGFGVLRQSGLVVVEVSWSVRLVPLLLFPRVASSVCIGWEYLLGFEFQLWCSRIGFVVFGRFLLS